MNPKLPSVKLIVYVAVSKLTSWKDSQPSVRPGGQRMSQCIPVAVCFQGCLNHIFVFLQQQAKTNLLSHFISVLFSILTLIFEHRRGPVLTVDYRDTKISHFSLDLPLVCLVNFRVEYRELPSIIMFIARKGIATCTWKECDLRLTRALQCILQAAYRESSNSTSRLAISCGLSRPKNDEQAQNCYRNTSYKLHESFWNNVSIWATAHLPLP